MVECPNFSDEFASFILEKSKSAREFSLLGINLAYKKHLKFKRRCMKVQNNDIIDYLLQSGSSKAKDKKIVLMKF